MTSATDCLRGEWFGRQHQWLYQGDRWVNSEHLSVPFLLQKFYRIVLQPSHFGER